MNGPRLRSRLAVGGLAATTALVVAGAASAHARLSPPVALSKELQLFTLAVPTEQQGATTRVELTPPAGFDIDSFVPSPGWKRLVEQTGSGESALVRKVTWTGGRVPTGDDATFSFLAQPSAGKTYTFRVRQTYASGKVVDWAGPESSDAPAPAIEAKSSLGGGGSSTLAIVALAVSTIAVVLAAAALLARGGGRSLA